MNALLGLAPPGSETPIVKLKVPFTEAVPLSTPLDGLRARPAGSVPLMTDHDSVPTPPVAVNVVE